jgi:hypothetical protein
MAFTNSSVIRPIQSYTGLLLDTNLLILLVAGLLSKEKIGKFKRTNCFIPQDFEVLEQIIAQSKQLFTTPNILTEATNLLDSELLPVLSVLTQNLTESYHPSIEIMNYDPACYLKFGLSDAVLRKVAEHGILILTVDAPFYHYASSLDLPVHNFNYVRQSYILPPKKP